MAHSIRALLLALAVVLLAASAQAAPAPFAPDTQRTFLPLMGSGPVRGFFGVELSWLTPDAGLAAMGPGWLRRNGLRWADVEPEPGAGYRWDAPSVQLLERQLAAAARLGLPVILVLHGSPPWAVAPFQASCAPINAEHYDAFAAFAAAAVARYSAPPFNVTYWQVGNEPDAFLVQGELPYGCWGRPEQELYGGQAYGDLLKLTYPAIKAANSRAIVLNGGLLLDAPYNPFTGQGRSARFLEGMLVAGAGTSFDLLAYHSYRFYDGTPDGGSPQDWKPGYLRSVLARYGLSKRLFNTEGALLCAAPSPACAQAQADTIPRLYARTLRDEVEGFIWYLYDNDGFRNTALIEPNEPSRVRVAYRAFAQVTSALDGMRLLGPLPDLPLGVEGYGFGSGQRRTAVIWANSPTTVALQLGARSASCQEQDGTALPCWVEPSGVITIEARSAARYISWIEP